MAPNSLHVAFALLLAGVVARSASAQVTIAPESPRWGDTFTVTADPSAWANETQRLDRSDQLYAYLYTRHQALGSPRERIWVPMTWDGRRFAATMTLPAGCEMA